MVVHGVVSNIFWKVIISIPFNPQNLHFFALLLLFCSFVPFKGTVIIILRRDSEKYSDIGVCSLFIKYKFVCVKFKNTEHPQIFSVQYFEALEFTSSWACSIVFVICFSLIWGIKLLRRLTNSRYDVDLCLQILFLFFYRIQGMTFHVDRHGLCDEASVFPLDISGLGCVCVLYVC